MAEKLPATKASDALAEPSDLEGWSSDDVAAALTQVVKGFRAQRLAIGLLLWKYRSLNVDAVYGDMQAKVAQDCDVDVRTLQRWRVFAEKKWALPPPDRRTEAVRAAVGTSKGGDKVSPPKQDPAPEPSEIVPLPEDDGEPEKITPDAVIDPTPDPEPEPDPPPAPKALQLSLFEERENRPLVPARAPLDAAEAEEAVRVGQAYLAWASLFEAVEAPAKPAAKPKARRKKAAPKKKREPVEKCVHPIGRRIDGQCAVCFEKVGGK